MMDILAKNDGFLVETLQQHTENTLKVLKSIKEAYPNIPELCEENNFWSYLFYSLFLHDFGKASIDFQKKLKKENNEWNNYRHEILSTSFVTSLNLSEEDRKIIGLGIITHHKDISQLNDKYHGFRSKNELKIFNEKLDTLKPNFNELIEYFDQVPILSQKYLDYTLEKPRQLEFNDLNNEYPKIATEYYNRVDEYKEGLDDKCRLQSLFGVFLRGFLMSCDHLASASEYELKYAKKEFKSLKNFKNLRTTQELASKTKGDAFLVAPTGSGKTEASWLWAINNQNELFSKRVFYFLPFTASINAMYERFQKEYGKDLIGLIHGKASYYLYKSLEKGTYKEKREQVKNIRSMTKKIYLPYKVLTPFQIIKYFFQVKGFEIGLSELANSLLIFDEIHAYNPRTTALIISILRILKKEYNVSILIMSATLPTFLVELFKRELGINNFIKLPENEIDSYTRHRTKIIEGSIFDNLNKIRQELSNGKRVLVICNTVQNAQKVFKELDDIEESALLHSRFILKDREKIESKLEDLTLLVGTQALEVSLDIDYDVLYSEPAPLDALIQRFGRINRKGWETNTIKTVNICTIGSDYDKYIYDEEIVQKTITLLNKEDILYESKIQKLIDEVYGEGYNEREQKEYDDTFTSFNNMYDDFAPFINEKSSENEFYKMFKQFEVVPLEFQEEYYKLIKEKEFYEASAYFVNISYKQFAIQYNKGNISNGGESYGKDTYFIDVEYDSELGLLLNQKEDDDDCLL